MTAPTRPKKRASTTRWTLNTAFLLELQAELAVYQEKLSACLELRKRLPLQPRSQAGPAPGSGLAQITPSSSRYQPTLPSARTQPSSRASKAARTIDERSFAHKLWADGFQWRPGVDLNYLWMQQRHDSLAFTYLDGASAAILHSDARGRPALQAMRLAYIPDWTSDDALCTWFVSNVDEIKLQHFKQALTSLLGSKQHFSYCPDYAWAVFLVRAAFEQRLHQTVKQQQQVLPTRQTAQARAQAFSSSPVHSAAAFRFAYAPSALPKQMHEQSPFASTTTPSVRAAEVTPDLIWPALPAPPTRPARSSSTINDQHDVVLMPLALPGAEISMQEPKVTVENSPGAGVKDGVGEVFCICRKAALGTMLGCEDKACKIGWFHLSCVKLRKVPKGDWFCVDCSLKKSKPAEPSSPLEYFAPPQPLKRQSSPIEDDSAEKRVRLQAATEVVEPMYKILREHWQSPDLPYLAEHLVNNGLTATDVPLLSRVELAMILNHELAESWRETAEQLMAAICPALFLPDEPLPLDDAQVKTALVEQTMIGCLSAMHPALVSSRCVDFAKATSLDFAALSRPIAEDSERWNVWGAHMAAYGSHLTITQQVLLYYRAEAWFQAVLRLRAGAGNEDALPVFWRRLPSIEVEVPS